MNIIAYTALHYGRDYLASAIRSVIDAVDEYHVIYTPIGSHGHRTDIPCPESRDELYYIAWSAAGSEKLRWHEDVFAYEGQQREAIHAYAPDADVILVVDADEVWSEATVKQATLHPSRLISSEPIARLRLPIIHYWRSFYRCVLHDPAFPDRIIYPNIQGETRTLANFTRQSGQASATNPTPPIHHFGYAQRPEIVEYKQHVHGHKGEWRRDVDWFHDRFMANAQLDCHPVGSDYWNPEPVDPFALGLPDWMRQHPYANLEVIE